MPNPLFNELGANGAGQEQMAKKVYNEIMRFRNSRSDDPRQAIMQMVNSGRITQNQLNFAQQVANKAQRMFEMFGLKI